MARKKKNTHGGANRGQGRHTKYNEETDTLSFRVPVSKMEEIDKMVKEKLEKWKVKKTI